LNTFKGRTHAAVNFTEEIKGIPSSFGDFVNIVENHEKLKSLKHCKSGVFEESKGKGNRIGKTIHMFTNSSMRDIPKKCHMTKEEPEALKYSPTVNDIKRISSYGLNKGQQPGTLMREIPFGRSYKGTEPVHKKSLVEESEIEEIRDTQNSDIGQPVDIAIGEPSQLIGYKFMRAVAPTKILLVEDQAVSGGLISTVIKNISKLDVDWAKNGKEALELYKEKSESYLLVLMDCEMPIMDGWESTRLIREFEKSNNKDEVEIWAMTGHSQKEYVDKCYSAGMNGHLAKPVHPKRILDIVNIRLCKT